MLIPIINIIRALKHKIKSFFIFVVILIAKLHIILLVKHRKHANLA